MLDKLWCQGLEDARENGSDSIYTFTICQYFYLQFWKLVVKERLVDIEELKIKISFLKKKNDIFTLD